MSIISTPNTALYSQNYTEECQIEDFLKFSGDHEKEINAICEYLDSLKQDVNDERLFEILWYARKESGLIRQKHRTEARIVG